MDSSTPISSTPIMPRTWTSKSIESQDYASSVGSNQDSMKIAVGHELDGYTWQFDSKRLAEVLLPKTRDSPLKQDQVDSLDAYSYKGIPVKVHRNAIKSFQVGTPPRFPASKTESDHYEPLCKILNKCIGACHTALGDSKGEYYSGLKFVKWDSPTQDGCSGENRLKPDLAGGIGLPGKEKIKEKGGLYWRRPGLAGHELLIPVEVKKGWRELVRQAGTYARCLFMASPLRKFALVFGYEYELKEFRVLVFHHGGLTSSQPLKLDAKIGTDDVLHIFLAILSWKTVVDAGLPLWSNDSHLILPGKQGFQHLQVKKILYDSHALRGRCARVVLVCDPDKSDKSKSNDIIPGPETICAPQRRSARLQTVTAAITKPMSKEATGSKLRPTASNTKPMSKEATGSKSRPTGEKGSTGLKSRSKELDIKDKPTSLPVGGDNDSFAPLPIVIPRNNGRIVKEVMQNIIGSASNLNFAAGIVVKSSWVSPAAESIESDLLHDCSGLFGTPKHYYSFLACHGNGSPATNHLFLPNDTEIEACYWPLFLSEAKSPEKRGLWVYISSFAGHSLATAPSPKMLIHAVLHACLGWFNLIQKGYLHRDISIGNLVMIDDAVTTEGFGILKKEGGMTTVESITTALHELKIDSSTKATWEKKLTATLDDLKITNKCHGFVIDGDMAIKLAGYFNREHPGSRSGTYEFMSDDMLSASESGERYLQSSVDDLYSFYYTMQWAAVFHNEEFAAKDVPPKLKALRKYLFGNQQDRSFATSKVTSGIPLKPLEYGSVLATCQPMLRAWYLELGVLGVDWHACQDELEGQAVKGEIYIPLFLTFALRGVAMFSEVVHKHTKNMD